MKLQNNILHAMAVAVMLSTGLTTSAQNTETGLWAWTGQQLNQMQNVKYDGLNPVYLTSNVQQNSGFATIDYALTRGNFHAADASGKRNDLNVFFGGLKHLDKLNLYGSLRYENQQARESAWKSALWLEPLNPFYIGDSIPSDVTVEAFYMEAAASYAFSERWTGALRIGLSTGSMSDQNDPRPKVNTSVLPITAGAEWQLATAWRLGAAAGLQLFNSDMGYSVVNGRVSHRFFLMKGMGDHYGLSTGGEPSYTRNFEGMSWHGALHGVWHAPQTAWTDFLELSFETGEQTCEDGGSSYTFKGGDYEYTRMGVKNRLQFRSAPNILHTLTLAASRVTGEGTWYDQRRMVDTEHNNRNYYQVLGQTKVHKPSRLSADATYRFDRLQDALPDLSAAVNAGIEQSTAKHLTDTGNPKQEYRLAHVWLNASKVLAVAGGRLTASLGGGLWLPLGEKTFASAAPNTGTGAVIGPAYVRPQFEFESAQYYRFGGKIDYLVPVPSKSFGVGVFVKADCRVYADDATYSDVYKSEKLTTADAGVYLNF